MPAANDVPKFLLILDCSSSDQNRRCYNAAFRLHFTKTLLELILNSDAVGLLYEWKRNISKAQKGQKDTCLVLERKQGN